MVLIWTIALLIYAAFVGTLVSERPTTNPPSTAQQRPPRPLNKTRPMFSKNLLILFTGLKLQVIKRVVGDLMLQRGCSMRALVLRFVNDQSAATAIEYGLIAAGISVAIIAVVNGLGTQLNTTFSSISTQLK